MDLKRPGKNNRGFMYLERVETSDRSITQVAKMRIDP